MFHYIAGVSTLTWNDQFTHIALLSLFFVKWSHALDCFDSKTFSLYTVNQCVFALLLIELKWLVCTTLSCFGCEGAHKSLLSTFGTITAKCQKATPLKFGMFDGFLEFDIRRRDCCHDACAFEKYNCQKNMIKGIDNLGGMWFRWIRQFGTSSQLELLLESHPYSSEEKIDWEYTYKGYAGMLYTTLLQSYKVSSQSIHISSMFA